MEYGATSEEDHLLESLVHSVYFLEGTDDLAKGYVMKKLAISFRGYRHDMNKKLLQKGRDPTKRYPITEA